MQQMNNHGHFRGLSLACVHAAFSPLSTVTFEALSGMKAPVLSGFGVFFRVSFRWGHGALLRTVVLSMTGPR
jgi:hypothetical protein